MTQRIDDSLFEHMELIGQGGMASVYKAREKSSGRLVAIKILDVEALPPLILVKALKRFEREGRVYQSLQHPNIIRIHEFHADPKFPYLVMEYVAGGTLKSRLATPTSWKDLLTTLIPIGRALQYVHETHLVHRDIKPSNILLTPDGKAILADFGVVQIMDQEDSVSLTETNKGVGTPEYMAPEQWNGKTTPLSDQYAYGTVLFEGLTGIKPFTASTPMGVLLRQSTEPVPALRKFVGEVPEELEKIITRSMSLDPAKRFPTMESLVNQMETLLDGTPRVIPTIKSKASKINITSAVKKIPRSVLFGILAALLVILPGLLLFGTGDQASLLPDNNPTPAITKSDSLSAPLEPVASLGYTATFTSFPSSTPTLEPTSTPTPNHTPTASVTASPTANSFNSAAAVGGPPIPASFSGICMNKKIYMRWNGYGNEWGFNLYRNGVFVYQSGPGFNEYYDKNELFDQPINYVLRSFNGAGQSEPAKAVVMGCKK